MDTASRLLTLDIWLKSEIKEEYLRKLEQYIFSTFTVLKKMKYQFTPYGLTQSFILSESHCAIHTYPEENFISYDLFICNKNLDLHQISTDILNFFPVHIYELNIVNRGVKPERQLKTLTPLSAGHTC